MINKTAFAAVFAAASLAGAAHAQTLPTSPFGLELRAGAAVPQGDLKEGTKVGYTVSTNVSYDATPVVSVFGGFNVTSFGFKDEVFADPDFPDDTSVRLQVAGAEAGVRLNVPVTGKITPFVKGSALYDRYSITVSDSDGTGSFADDQWRWGFDVGAGVSVPIGPRLSVTPGVSYMKVEHATAVKVDIGLAIRL
ncbi:MAG TPA: outer membrane beta-barrel protein [Longimicrobiaceae bacterium]|nr:outer membrane beta-barrel protein [Longimicrobiaceae bacterium]